MVSGNQECPNEANDMDEVGGKKKKRGGPYWILLGGQEWQISSCFIYLFF